MNIRIMIYNTGYFRGLTGKLSEYLFKFHRILFACPSFKDGLSKEITELVKANRPDVLFMEETRDEPYMLRIKALFEESHIDEKYEPGSFLRRLPFFKGNCNAVFLNKPFHVTKRYLKNGTKKLVYQVDVGADTSFFFSHFALGKATRKKQFLEIAEMVKEKKQAIVAGDFNIFGGALEVKELTETAHLKVANNLKEKTFPSFNPKHTIDLFLTSPSIKIIDIRVLQGVQFSDHVPVIIDVSVDS